jgi:hypothetical protein
MKRILTCILIGACTITGGSLYGKCKTACGNGNWEAASTWFPDVVPDCGDTVIIPAGKLVTVTSVYDYTYCNASMYIDIFGELTFQTGKKLKLPCNSTVFVETGGKMSAGGGGGMSNYLEICDQVVWNASDGTVYGPTMFFVGRPLPIGLVSFSALENKRQIDVQWQTASELNNDYFTIERSTDGINFEPVMQVKGAGTISTNSFYSATDYAPFQGESYYRLTQTDFDGTTARFIPVMVNIKQKALQLYPNPNPGKFTLVIPGAEKNQRIKISDVVGNAVYISSANELNMLDINLQAGIYFAEIVGGKELEKKMFVVER